MKINTKKSLDTIEMAIKYRATKAKERKYNYIQPRFKYCNDYNLYTRNENKYNHTSNVKIAEEPKDRKFSENISRTDYRVKDQSTSATKSIKILPPISRQKL